MIPGRLHPEMTEARSIRRTATREAFSILFLFKGLLFNT
jgi:hypothetical protein